jgi:hypothetical protein
MNIIFYCKKNLLMRKAGAGLLFVILLFSGCGIVKQLPKKIIIGDVEKQAKKQKIVPAKTTYIKLKGYTVAYLLFSVNRRYIKEQCGYKFHEDNGNAITEFILPHVIHDSLKIDTLHFEVSRSEQNPVLKTWFTYGLLHYGSASYVSSKTIRVGKKSYQIEKYCLPVPVTDQISRKTRYDNVTVYYSSQYGVIKAIGIPYRFTLVQPGTKTGRMIKKLLHKIKSDKEFRKQCNS